MVLSISISTNQAGLSCFALTSFLLKSAHALAVLHLYRNIGAAEPLSRCGHLKVTAVELIVQNKSIQDCVQVTILCPTGTMQMPKLMQLLPASVLFHNFGDFMLPECSGLNAIGHQVKACPKFGFQLPHLRLRHWARRQSLNNG